MIGETIINGKFKISIEMDIKDADEILEKMIRNYIQSKSYELMGDLSIVEDIELFNEFRKIGTIGMEMKMKLLKNLH